MKIELCEPKEIRRPFPSVPFLARHTSLGLVALIQKVNLEESDAFGTVLDAGISIGHTVGSYANWYFHLNNWEILPVGTTITLTQNE